ncbi:MAG: OmpH family outer membrane protein [Rickettsiaceae bacterium]
MMFLRWLLIIIFFSPITTLAEDNTPCYAVVDIESILEHSLAVQHIKKNINIISHNIQNDLVEKEIELKRIEANLIKQRGTLSEEEFNNKVLEFNAKVRESQQEAQQRKVALEQAHSDALKEVYKNTMAVIDQLARQKNFDIIFPSSQILFVKNDLNITAEVLSHLNDRLKKVKINY